MENYQESSPPNPQSQPEVLEQSSQAPSNGSLISGKIEQMAKSLADVALSSSSKPMDTFKKIQDQRQQQEKYIVRVQAGLLQELNSIEKTLLNFDKDQVFYQVSSKIKQEEIQEHLSDFRFELRRMSDQVHKKLFQYGDKTADVKVKSIQIESQSKQKALKLQRDINNKLNILEKGVFPSNSSIDSKKIQLKKQFKELRVEIQVENKQLEKDQRKRQILISQLQSNLKGRIKAQRIRQKEGFQQHYRTLEEIFRLLEEQIDQKQ